MVQALADAQQRLDFRHCDLRLSYVMQHTPLQHAPAMTTSAYKSQRAAAVQVSEELADAQQRLGFRHWDLRLSNVMQHTPLQHGNELSPAAREAWTSI